MMGDMAQIKGLGPKESGKISVFLKINQQTKNNVKHTPKEKHKDLKTTDSFRNMWYITYIIFLSK